MASERFIAKVTYVANRRKAVFYVKLPYGAVFDMSEKLARLWALGEIDWFRIDTIRPGEVTPEIRAGLQRWLPALTLSTVRTRLDALA